MNNEVTIGSAADLLGCSVDTLRRWDKLGQLPARRKSKGGYRYYSASDLEEFSKHLNRFKIARKWTRIKKSFEPLSLYYCSDSFVFQSHLSRMERELGENKKDYDFLSLVVAIAGEIGNNSFDHNIGNWPDISGVFFSYDSSKKKIVLADRGQGVLKTLKRVRPKLSSHEDALRTAFTEVISGRLPEHRGNGLKFVRDIVRETKINLIFQTGNASLCLDNSQDLKIDKLKHKISGCLVQIKF